MLYRKHMKCILRIPRGPIIFVSLCLCALVPALSRAQTPAVQATVDTTRTALDSPIRLSVTLSGEDGTVDTSIIQDFQVLSQASGSSIQIINGRVNRERHVHLHAASFTGGQSIDSRPARHNGWKNNLHATHSRFRYQKVRVLRMPPQMFK